MKAALITEEQIKAIEDALEDMLSGWKYIRESHGDLYGIGWDRAESKAVKALTIVRSLKVQEPVAWITRRTGDGGVVISGYETCEPTDYDAIPVYTAPTKREWQALAQPEQEPYGYVWTSVRDGMEVRFSRMSPNDFYKPQDIKPVYTAPPSKPWVSLTDEEIDYIWGVTPPDYENFFEFPRAIEAKLKEKNNG